MTSRSVAATLLHDLVAVPSVSEHEERASALLVERMGALGYERAYVDDAGNAVGERGPEDAARVLVLLGHIDTVPGDIPVRFEPQGNDEILHGRGTVDAKGPLVTFAVAGSQLDAEDLERAGVRLVVVGAVEEESATSRGARAIRARFDGASEPIPAACVIGEPSRFHRVTLGYKGRVLLDVRAEQELAHTAGPDPGIAVQLIDLWNLIAATAERFNLGVEKPFEQLQPSVRSMTSGLDDGFLAWAEASLGIRLPVGFEVETTLRRVLADWHEFAQRREAVAGNDAADSRLPAIELAHGGFEARWRVGGRQLEVRARGYEPAWRSERSTGLVRAFQRSIRAAGARPGFVVKTGTSDMNVVGPAWQCPILAYGPGDSALDHTPQEHVSVRELDAAVEVLREALSVWIELDLAGRTGGSAAQEGTLPPPAVR